MAATWDLRRLQQYLDKHEPGSLYFLFGEESYLGDEALGLIRKKALQDGAVDFNFDQFYAGDVDVSQVRDTVETLPVMCSRRVVVYKGVHALKEKDWAILESVLENPIESTCLILLAEKADKRKKHYKKIQDNGVAVELKRPYENQVPAWIDYIGFQNELELSKEAISLIHQMVGSNLSEINSEIKKLKQFLGDRRAVSPEDVLKVISQARIDSIFDLTNAIGRKDRAAALTLLANLLDHGQSENAALALILRHIRILATLKEGVKQGLSGAKLSAKAGVPSFFLNQYLAQCRQWSDGKIAHTIAVLHRTDQALKSSPVSSHIWLENFIIQACS